MSKAPQYQWEGVPYRPSKGAPYYCRIALDRGDDPLPEINDKVLIKGYRGAQFIAPILGIVEGQKMNLRGEGSVLVLAGDPPWAKETRLARLARDEAKAIAATRRMEARKAAGLCPVCAEGDLTNCACVRGARAAAQAKQQEAEDAAEKERREDEHNARCEEHNRQAEERRKALTPEIVREALFKEDGDLFDSGNLAKAGGKLGVEIYKTDQQNYPENPNSRFLFEWLKNHAPELLKERRDVIQTKADEKKIASLREYGVCLTCFRPLKPDGTCTQEAVWATYKSDGSHRVNQKHYRDTDRDSVEKRKQFAQEVLGELENTSNRCPDNGEPISTGR